MREQTNISELIAAAQAGDVEAKDQLLGQYREYLRLLAHVHVRPLLKAKYSESDIVQETCLQAMLEIERFRGDSEQQFAAWLRKILANKGAWLARQYFTEKRDARLEQKMVEKIDQSSIDMGALIPDRFSTPSQIAMGRERSVLLAEAIGQLKDDQREVLIMHGLQRMSISDVAKSLDRTEASTWKLWARGLHALKEKMGDID